jgi:hypothetical protein
LLAGGIVRLEGIDDLDQTCARGKECVSQAIEDHARAPFPWNSLQNSLGLLRRDVWMSCRPSQSSIRSGSEIVVTIRSTMFRASASSDAVMFVLRAT